MPPFGNTGDVDLLRSARPRPTSAVTSRLQEADIVDAGGLRFPAIVPLLSDAAEEAVKRCARAASAKPEFSAVHAAVEVCPCRTRWSVPVPARRQHNRLALTLMVRTYMVSAALPDASASAGARAKKPSREFA